MNVSGEPRKIAMVGCGAMGSVYAARLAGGGHDVVAIDGWRGHIEAIAADGLRVTGPDGERWAQLRAFATPPIEIMDLVVVAVKAADARAAAGSLAPMVGPDTVVVTIQNGLGADDEVAAVVGGDRLVVGIASGFGAALDGPGQARHESMRALRFGAYDGLDDRRLGQVVDIWRSGGFEASAVADVRAMQWDKLICNVAYSAPCALTGMTVGQLMDDSVMGPVSRSAATEAWQVARALGVGIATDDPVSAVRDFGSRMPDARPSALIDHDHRRASEVGLINGAVPREAAKAGLEAPVNRTLTALVQTKEAAWD